MPYIKLKSSDDETFNVDVKVAACSKTIKTMLEDLGMPEEEDNDPIPLPNVKGSILKRVLKWAEYHQNDPVVEEDDMADKKSIDLIPWDQEFLKVDQEVLFALILAANYLDIKALLDTTCKHLANMIKGKSPEEIRKVCNLKMDPNQSKDSQKVCEKIEPAKETTVAAPTRMTLRSRKSDAK